MQFEFGIIYIMVDIVIYTIMSVKLIAVLLLVAALTANFSPILVNSINAQNLNVKVSGIGNTTNSSLGGNTMGTGNMSNAIITNST
ncbi:MAG: hypothetical protein WB511_11985 [Nitrososphaeraceae archaeon]